MTRRARDAAQGSLLVGPDLGPAVLDDEFMREAAIVIRRANLSISDWWARDATADDRRRLQVEIARALRQEAQRTADPHAEGRPA
jgi:hypothetical protein